MNNFCPRIRFLGMFEKTKTLFDLSNLIRDETGEESDGFFDLTAVQESLQTLLFLMVGDALCIDEEKGGISLPSEF
jgi:hypothetical protein